MTEVVETDKKAKWNQSTSYLLLLAIITGQLFIFLYSTWYGIATEYDSLHYISAAKSLAENGTLKNIDGTAYTAWPPLYPFILSLFGTKYILVWARVVQCLCYCINTGILYFASFYLFEKNSTRITFLVFTCLSATLLIVYRFAWTEGLFIILLYLSFLFFCKSDYKITIYFFISSIINNLLCMQRLAGIFFVAALCICWILVSGKKFSFRTVIESAAYFTLSAVSMIIWNYRNSFIEENPSYLGNIGLSDYTHGIFFYAKGFTSWFIPSVLSNPVIEVLLFGAFAMYLFYIILQSQEKRLQKTLAVIILIYITIMIGINKDITEDYERYLAPIFIPVMIIVCLLVEKTLKLVSGFGFIIKILLIASMVYVGLRTIKNADFGHDSGCRQSSLSESKFNSNKKSSVKSFFCFL